MAENNVVRWKLLCGWTVDVSQPPVGEGGEGHFRVIDENGEVVRGVMEVNVHLLAGARPEVTVRTV